MSSTRSIAALVFLFLCFEIAFAQESLRLIPYKPDPPIALDGKLGDWQSVPGSWEEDAIGATVFAAWRDEALFLALQASGTSLTSLFVAVEHGADAARRAFLFDLSTVPPTATAASPEGVSAAGILVSAESTAAGWTLEASIPWPLLGMSAAQTGRIFSLGAAPAEGFTPESMALSAAVLSGADGSLNDAPPVGTMFSEAQLAPGATESFSVEVPACPEGLRVVLSLLARQEFETVAGYAPVLRVNVNDAPAGGDRMRNRPLRLKARGGDVYSMAAGEVLAVYYSPDFTSPDTHSHYGPVEPVRVCLIELDITDLVQPGNNTFLVEHTSPSSPCPMILAEGALYFRTPPPPDREKAGPPQGPLPRMAPTSAPSTDIEARAVSDSVIEIRTGNEVFLVESRFSTPEPAWVTGENTWFGWERTLERTGEAVIVRDAFTNRTDAPLPLMRRNEIQFGDRLETLWLAGLERMDKSGYSASPANPTTFAATSQSGIGLMPLDDVSRVHVANHAGEGAVGLSDNNLVLRPGASYTAEWAIIPTGKPDYWAFINTARRLCDVNFTVDGAFAFLRADPRTDVWSDQETADFLRFKSAKYVCASINYPLHQGRYPHGTAFQHITHDNYRNSFARWKVLVPDIQTMVYFHCFIDVMDGSPKIYADARLLQPDGSQADYGQDHDRIFIPTAENTFGRDVAKNVDIILDDIGADGVYWDEHEYSRYHYHHGEPWDGFTGDIDPRTMQVSRLKSSVTLLSESWRLALAEEILKKGPLIGNGPPFTRAMAALRFPCFVETGSITHCTQAHLYSPIALGDHLTERSETEAYRTMLAALDYGCVYHWYNDLTVVPTHFHLVQYMYPITPMELHGGYIIGEERIISRVSGIFGWNDASIHEVHVFDDTGREVEGFQAPKLSEDGKTWTELRLAEDWSAVIVRQ